MGKYYLILPPTPLMKTEGFLTCSKMACAKGSCIQNGVQEEQQISVKVLLSVFEFDTAAMSILRVDKKLKICNYISSSGISLLL
jgi:hypothetical protein